MKCFIMISNVWPLRSYIAIRKNGSMTSIITNAAVLVPTLPLSKKKSGTPISTAGVKHMSCRLVNPNNTLLFTLVKSFGTVTYAKISTPFEATKKQPDIGCSKMIVLCTLVHDFDKTPN